MLKDITLGQYFSGNSPLHRLDPRTKIIMVLIYVISIFFAQNILSLALMIFCAVAAVAVSGISPKVVLKSIKPILFLVIFTAFINVFLTTSDTEPLVSWKFITIYKEGVINAVFMIVRIVCLVIGTSVMLTYTTSPITLTDGLERLLKPLKKLHVPVHEFAMMMTIALRFIPTLLEETDKIINAQKARGAGFDSKGIVNKAKAFLPILIPLFISAFRRADELAIAMECRCYRGDEGRTRMRILNYKRLDLITFILIALFIVALLLLNQVTSVYSI